MFENYRDTLQPHYDFLASFWDQLTGNVNYEGAFKFIDEVRTRLGLEKKVLDVLCGTGTLLEFFERNGYETFGVELSTNMLEIASKKLSRSVLIEGDYHLVPYQEQFPLIVIHNNSLMHVVSKTEFVSVLKYLKSKLVDDGVLIFDVTPRTLEEGESFCVNKVEQEDRFLSITRYEYPFQSIILQKNLYSIFHRKAKLFEVREIEMILGAFTKQDIISFSEEAGYYLLDFDDLVPYSSNVFVLQKTGLQHA